MLEAFVDAPQQYGPLTVFPVIAPQGPVLPFLLANQVQEPGVLTVREKGDELAPILLIRNQSLHPILILSGEPLSGPSRDWCVQRSVLLGGKSVTQIPARGLEDKGWVDPHREAEITSWMEHFPAVKHQVGFLAFLQRRMLALEAIGANHLYDAFHRRLLIKIIQEALDDSSEKPEDLALLEEEARRIVAAVHDADRVSAKKVGVGDYWILNGPVFGADLIYQGQLVHLSVRPSSVGRAKSLQGGNALCS